MCPYNLSISGKWIWLDVCNVGLREKDIDINKHEINLHKEGDPKELTTEEPKTLQIDKASVLRIVQITQKNKSHKVDGRVLSFHFSDLIEIKEENLQREAKSIIVSSKHDK